MNSISKILIACSLWSTYISPEIYAKNIASTIVSQIETYKTVEVEVDGTKVRVFYTDPSSKNKSFWIEGKLRSEEDKYKALFAALMSEELSMFNASMDYVSKLEEKLKEESQYINRKFSELNVNVTYHNFDESKEAFIEFMKDEGIDDFGNFLKNFSETENPEENLKKIVIHTYKSNLNFYNLIDMRFILYCFAEEGKEKIKEWFEEREIDFPLSFDEALYLWDKVENSDFFSKYMITSLFLYLEKDRIEKFSEDWINPERMIYFWKKMQDKDFYMKNLRDFANDAQNLKQSPNPEEQMEAYESYLRNSEIIRKYGKDGYLGLIYGLICNAYHLKGKLKDEDIFKFQGSLIGISWAPLLLDLYKSKEEIMEKYGWMEDIEKTVNSYELKR